MARDIYVYTEMAFCEGFGVHIDGKTEKNGVWESMCTREKKGKVALEGVEWGFGIRGNVHIELGMGPGHLCVHGNGVL